MRARLEKGQKASKRCYCRDPYDNTAVGGDVAAR